MALSSTTVWEVRTTGSDSNGGGFRTGASGTDYSQQDAPVLSITDGAASGSTTLTSATGGFTAAMIGNVLQISGGSLTAGFYEITGYTDSNTVTLDRSPGTGSGSTIKVGGALATPAAAFAAAVPGNSFWIKHGTYSLANASLSLPTWSNFNAVVVSGYNATRGDLDGVTSFANFPTIQKTAGTESIFVLTGTGQRIRCLIIDGNSLAANGVTMSGATCSMVDQCKLMGCTGYGVNLPSLSALALRCLATGCGVGFNTNTVACVATGNTTGFTLGSDRKYDSSIAYANSQDGFLGASTYYTLTRCISHANGRDGLRTGGSQAFMSVVVNCIFTSNGGYGVNGGSGTIPTWIGSDFNAFGGGASANTLGARNGVPVGANDVSLAGDPFVDAASGNFALNAVAGCGALLRAAGYPGTLPGGLTTGAVDIGASQHADPPPSSQGRIFGSGVILSKGVRP